MGDNGGYLDVIELRSAIREYKNLPSGSRMPDKLGEMFLLIANKIASKPCFSGYSFKNEFISDAVHKMVANVHRIDPDDPRSPFSYLTLLTHRCFLQRIKKEKRYSEIKDSLAERVWSEFNTYQQTGKHEESSECNCGFD